MENTSTITIENTPTTIQTEGPAVVVPFVFDASYKGDEVTRQVADILGFTDIQGWSVIDHDVEAKLALVHYNDGFHDKSLDNMKDYGDLRGVLVDLEVGAVIADSFGYTPTSIKSELVATDDSLAIRDTDDETHIFDMKTAVIKRVFEGVVIRAIWHKSKLYLITHRKINPIRSRWGSAKSFLTMYEEAHGPTAEQLFDITKPYSSTCYNFLVVDHSLLVGTRQKVTAPYLVYLAERQMDIKRPAEEVAPGKGDFVTSDNIGGSVLESFIHKPKPLTLEEANHHLKFGYYNSFAIEDPRQHTGEALIIYDTVNGTIVKIHSPAYEWRVNLRGNNPNITNQFYSLLPSVYPDVNTDQAWNLLKSKFIPFPLYAEQSLKDLYNQTGSVLTIPSGPASKEQYANRDSRIQLLWMNFVLSLPASMQGQGIEILTQFKKDRSNVIEWLQNIEATHKDIEKEEFHPRIKGVINSARRLARERMSKGENKSANGSIMRLPVLIKSTIRNLINKENGTSLYSLVREMKKPVEEEKKKEQEVKAIPEEVKVQENTKEEL